MVSPPVVHRAPAFMVGFAVLQGYGQVVAVVVRQGTIQADRQLRALPGTGLLVFSKVGGGP